MAQDNKKVRFIRKNGRVIPIKVKPGQAQAQKSKPKRSLAEKHSFNEGRSQHLKGRAKKLEKRHDKKTGRMALIGAAIGTFGGKGKRLKNAAIGGVMGALAGAFSGRKLGKKASNLRASAERHETKAGNQYVELKKKGREEEVGDGSSRRAFQRGLSGKKFNKTSF